MLSQHGGLHRDTWFVKIKHLLLGHWYDLRINVNIDYLAFCINMLCLNIFTAIQTEIPFTKSMYCFAVFPLSSLFRNDTGNTFKGLFRSEEPEFGVLWALECLNLDSQWHFMKMAASKSPHKRKHKRKIAKLCLWNCCYYRSFQ